MDSRYRIELKEAGQGGFGRIDKAWDNTLERWLAIKTLDPLFKDCPSLEDKERFRREAKTLASLTHTNIPAVYDVVFPDDGTDFKIFFQWVNGISAREYLRDRGLINLDQVRKWFGNICSALTHAHASGIIHRDVKPSNLIITDDLESCYLVDFGIALRTSDLRRLTPGTPIGSPGYMSPEQERGEELTHVSDLFSLGVVLYECLAGSKPTIGKYTPLNTINEAIPTSIDTLIKKCLQEKSERIQSAVEFIDELKGALRPRATFSLVLSQGSLADLHLALTKMSPEEYNYLPLGQRTLITTRLKDMIRINANHMRNPIASLLSDMVRLCSFTAGKDLEYIIEKAISFGYEVSYGEQWKGNIAIRNELNNIALVCHSAAHRVITGKVIEFWADMNKAADKETWYTHDLRIFFQNLLANDQCTSDICESIANRLEQLNELTH
jgi:serine/threonine protein kinase